MMSEQYKYEEERGRGHHHEDSDGCGCEHHHEDGEGCGCEHHHGEGEGCGCEHHHGEGEGCGCGHHHHHGEQQTAAAPYTVQGQMLGSSAVTTSTVTVMAKYSDIEALAKKELQGLADWVTGRNGAIIQLKSALVAIHSTMMAMTEDGKNMDTIVPEKEEIRVQFVMMTDHIPLDDLKAQLTELCEKMMSAAR